MNPRALFSDLEALFRHRAAERELKLELIVEPSVPDALLLDYLRPYGFRLSEVENGEQALQAFAQQLVAQPKQHQQALLLL